MWKSRAWIAIALDSQVRGEKLSEGDPSVTIKVSSASAYVARHSRYLDPDPFELIPMLK